MNFPILSSLILLPIVGALFIFFINSDKNNKSTKYVSLFISLANLLLSLYLWLVFNKDTSNFQFVENREWLGIINYKVGIDGISILFVIYFGYGVINDWGFLLIRFSNFLPIL
jgi:NADH-quinone oxidoreductase subunit M